MIGTLVSIEGIDGSGKSTLASQLQAALSAHGSQSVLVSRKQTEGYESPYIARAMGGLATVLWGARAGDPVHEIPESVWMQLHSAWYQLMQQHLLPALTARHDFVVLDGWKYKCLARHRSNGEYDAELIAPLFRDIREPDVVLFLDVEPATCWARRPAFRASELGGHAQGLSGEVRERFLTYQERVRQHFRGMADASWRTISNPLESPADTADALAKALIAERHYAVARGVGG